MEHQQNTKYKPSLSAAETVRFCTLPPLGEGETECDKASLAANC